MAWSVAMLAVAVMFIAVQLLRDSRATVQLGPDDLLDRRWSCKPIDWQNIAEFDPVGWFGIPVVDLRLIAPELDPPAIPFARRARAFDPVAGDAMLAPVAGLDCTAEALSVRILEISTAAIQAAEVAEAWAVGSEYAAPPQG